MAGLQYTHVEEILRGMDNIDKEFRIKASICTSAFANIDCLCTLKASEVNAICEAIHNYWIMHDCVADIDDFCYYLNDYLEERGSVDSECLKKAWETALDAIENSINNTRN